MTAIRLMVVAYILSLPFIGATDTRVFYGDTVHPVESGEVWVVANGWGAYPAVMVANIQAGTLVEQQTRPAAGWADAVDYRLIVGAGVIKQWSPAMQSAGYQAFEGRFGAVYVSPATTDKAIATNWRAALKLVAHSEGDSFVLPLPRKRTVRLLYPDGKPLANEPVEDIALYGSDQNHCGHAVGISVKPEATRGEAPAFRTDENGEITVVTTPGDLVVRHRNYAQVNGGPAGTGFEVKDHVLLSDAQPAARALWSLPEYDYELGFRTPEGLLLSRIRVDACLWRIPCGVGCGQLIAPDWDGPTIRFRARDLRTVGAMTATDHAGRQRKLTDREMHDLLTTHRLTVVWK